MALTDTILARAWRRAQSRNLQKEGFLEDGLAAALEAPGVWERLVAHLGWSGHVSSLQPEVTSQDWLEEGRTDILLTREVLSGGALDFPILEVLRSPIGYRSPREIVDTLKQQWAVSENEVRGRLLRMSSSGFVEEAQSRDFTITDAGVAAADQNKLATR